MGDLKMESGWDSYTLPLSPSEQRRKNILGERKRAQEVVKCQVIFNERFNEGDRDYVLVLTEQSMKEQD